MSNHLNEFDKVVKREYIRLLRKHFKDYKDSKVPSVYSWNYYCYTVLREAYHKKFIL